MDEPITERTDSSAEPPAPPADHPQPPVAAYYSLVDALEALDNDPRHRNCRPVPLDTTLRFLDVRDYGTVTATTRYPLCLSGEMGARGAIVIAAFVEGVNDEFAEPCPATVEGMGW